MDSIRTVAVVGAGTMGLGIAQVAATSGCTTFLYDVRPEQVALALSTVEKNLSEAVAKGRISVEQKEQTLLRLRPANQLDQLKTDLVVEAAVERLEIKQDLFSRLEQINEGKAILVSNTSSLSISSIASVLKDPSRCAGFHFFNPADRMKLVEIIATESTDPAIVETLKQFSVQIGKTAVMAKDSPGFIVNRVARHFYLESLKINEEGASVEKIDALTRSAGFRMGPFELMDMIGVDINLAVTRSVYDGFNQEHKFRPNTIQEAMVKSGNLGRKTGKGFYDYSGKS